MRRNGGGLRGTGWNWGCIRRERREFWFLVEVGPMAKEFCEVLLRAGVIVRPLGWMGFPEAMRVSVGTPAENDEFLAVMRKLLARGDAPGSACGRMAR